MKHVKIFFVLMCLSLISISTVYAKPWRPLTKLQYLKLNHKQKKAYVTDLRRSFSQFEQKSKKYKLVEQRPIPSVMQLFAVAFAEEVQFCLIGGVQRQMKAVAGGNFVCPTYGRSCEGQSDGFLCGAIYSNQCVSREPIEDISSRCNVASAGIVPTDAQYEVIRNASVTIFNRICKTTGQAFDPKNCVEFEARLRQLDVAYSDPAGAPEAATVAASPAAAGEGAQAAAAAAAPAEGAADAAAAAGGDDAVAAGGAAQVDTNTANPLGGPADESLASECRRAFGVFIEGASSTGTQADQLQHENMAREIKAFSKFAEGVHVIPPARASGATNVEVSIEDRAKLDAILKFVNDSEDDTVCNHADDVLGVMLEKPRTTKSVASADFDSYGALSFQNQTVGVGASVIGPGAEVKYVDVSQAKLNAENSPVLQELARRKELCGERSDFVVQVKVAAHGSANCELSLGEGSNKVSPEKLHENVIKPFEEMGVKVVLNVSSSFSGCYARLKQKLKPSTCLMTSTRGDSAAYGSDALMGITYDSTYSHFLSQLNNPLKAHYCAAAADALNQPLAAAAQQPSNNAGRGDFNNRYTTAAFGDVSKRLGFEGLSSECSAARAQPSFPKDGLQSLPQPKAAALMACPKMRQAFASGLGLNGAIQPQFLESLLKRDNWPGLDGLRQIASNSQSARTIKESCGLDLNDYRDPDTLRVLERRGVTIDRTQGISH